jgi:hypothetical protein
MTPIAADALTATIAAKMGLVTDEINRLIALGETLAVVYGMFPENVTELTTAGYAVNDTTPTGSTIITHSIDWNPAP